MSSSSRFTVIAALITIWAIFGFLDVRNFTYSGYSTDGNNLVTQVTDGGPAAAAGMQVGDQIRSVGGVAVEDSRAAARRPRAGIGETRTFAVDRGTESVEFDLSYAAQPASQTLTSYLGIVVGLLFLWMGLWAFRKAPNAHTRRLAIVGALFGLVFTGGPYLTSYGLRMVVGAVVIFGVIVGFATLLHFLLAFPDKAEPNTRLVYGPAVLVGLVPVVFTILQPDSTSGVNLFFRLLFGLFVLSYFGLGIVAMLRTWNGASPEHRERHGLTMMVLGVVLGMVPLLLANLLGLVAPRVVIPGSQYLGLLLGLIPITFALAAVKSASGGTAAAPAAAVPTAGEPD